MKQSIEEIVLEFSGIISNDIAQRKFYDVAEVKAYVKVMLMDALKQCVTIQSTSLEDKRNELAKKYAEIYTNKNVSNYEKTKLAAQITEINAKIKNHNKFENKTEDKIAESILKERKKVTTIADKTLLARIIKIHEEKKFGNNITRDVIMCLSFNKNTPYKNESNYIKVKFSGEFSKKILMHKEGDLVYFTYNLLGKSFIDNDGKEKWVHKILGSHIIKYTEE